MYDVLYVLYRSQRIVSCLCNKIQTFKYSTKNQSMKNELQRGRCSRTRTVYCHEASTVIPVFTNRSTWATYAPPWAHLFAECSYKNIFVTVPHDEPLRFNLLATCESTRGTRTLQKKLNCAKYTRLTISPIPLRMYEITSAYEITRYIR